MAPRNPDVEVKYKCRRCEKLISGEERESHRLHHKKTRAKQNFSGSSFVTNGPAEDAQPKKSIRSAKVYDRAAHKAYKSRKFESG